MADDKVKGHSIDYTESINFLKEEKEELKRNYHVLR